MLRFLVSTIHGDTAHFLGVLGITDFLISDVTNYFFVFGWNAYISSPPLPPFYAILFASLCQRWTWFEKRIRRGKSKNIYLRDISSYNKNLVSVFKQNELNIPFFPGWIILFRWTNLSIYIDKFNRREKKFGTIIRLHEISKSIILFCGKITKFATINLIHVFF